MKLLFLLLVLSNASFANVIKKNKLAQYEHGCSVKEYSDTADLIVKVYVENKRLVLGTEISENGKFETEPMMNKGKVSIIEDAKTFTFTVAGQEKLQIEKEKKFEKYRSDNYHGVYTDENGVDYKVRCIKWSELIQQPAGSVRN